MCKLVRWCARSALFALESLALGCGSTSRNGEVAGEGGGGSGGVTGTAGALAGAGDSGEAGQAGKGGSAGSGGSAAGGGVGGDRAGSTATSGTGSTAGTGSDAGRAGMSGGGTAGSAGANAAGAGGTVDAPSLDMNDVTILAPLPPSGATAVLLRGTDVAEDGTVFVPRALSDRLVEARDGSGRVLRSDVHALLHLVAVRFDLCDRQLPGVCPEAEDARLRLVFQPIHNDGASEDVGFHAFYAIRNAEIADAVAALRALARSAPPQGGALRVSPALSAVNREAYAEKLRAFVKQFGGEGRLIRLTMNAQPDKFSQARWEFRGLEKKGEAFVDMPIVGSTATSEQVIFQGTSSYDVEPSTDTPAGLLGAITTRTFDAASAATKREYLAALAAAENPLSHTSETVPCVACHVSTFVTHTQAKSWTIDPLTLPGRYTSRYDLSVTGGSSPTSIATRALGYVGRTPLISQRVVNETAQTLTEIAARYPEVQSD